MFTRKCSNVWRQIWRVTGRESGSPELLGSPPTSPKKFPELLRKFSHCGTKQQCRGSPEVPQTSPDVSPFLWEAWHPLLTLKTFLSILVSFSQLSSGCVRQQRTNFLRSWKVLSQEPSGDGIARSCRHTAPDLTAKTGGERQDRKHFLSQYVINTLFLQIGVSMSSLFSGTDRISLR